MRAPPPGTSPPGPLSHRPPTGRERGEGRAGPRTRRSPPRSLRPGRHREPDRGCDGGSRAAGSRVLQPRPTRRSRTTPRAGLGRRRGRRGSWRGLLGAEAHRAAPPGQIHGLAECGLEGPGDEDLAEACGGGGLPRDDRDAGFAGYDIATDREHTTSFSAVCLLFRSLGTGADQRPDGYGVGGATEWAEAFRTSPPGPLSDRTPGPRERGNPRPGHGRARTNTDEHQRGRASCGASGGGGYGVLEGHGFVEALFPGQAAVLVEVLGDFEVEGLADAVWSVFDEGAKHGLCAGEEAELALVVRAPVLRAEVDDA